ncbi:MAG: ribonuclease D [Proteobacteria bacterium]|nr:ribonuclease D [Pseudomonadota bacterium]
MIIHTSDDLATLADRLSSQDAIALDTEFLRERTYRAELCLLQVATRDHAACIDPLTADSLAPVLPVLAASPPLKVLHAARQDLEVLLPATGLVAPVFDTQVAAALAGYPPQVGYAELVRRMLNIELAKAHTRTDWSRRPLSAEQLEYALDDVRHLLPLHAELTEQLAGLGRLAWLAEELRPLADAGQLVVDPEDAWRRLKGLAGLDPGRDVLARKLAAWRERRASDRNRPRGWILDDAVLREIVLQVPRSTAALQRIPQMPESVVRNSGTDLLAMVAASEIASPPPALPKRQRPDPALTAAAKRLSEVTATVAAELAIAPEVLATRRDLEQVARGDAGAAPLVGWRRDVVGVRLLAVAAGS